MDYKEALKAAIDGKKVRVCEWQEHEFVRFDSVWFIDEYGHNCPMSSFAGQEKWELYVEPPASKMFYVGETTTEITLTPSANMEVAFGYGNVQLRGAMTNDSRWAICLSTDSGDAAQVPATGNVLLSFPTEAYARAVMSAILNTPYDGADGSTTFGDSLNG